MPKKVHYLDEFRPLIQRLQASQTEYALIGGLAVAQYGERYLSASQKYNHHFPIYSKDIDFCGGQSLYEALQREIPAMGMQLVSGMGAVRPKPETNRVPGYVLAVMLDGESTSIEIMERLPLHNLDLPENHVTGSFVTIDGIVILDPCTLLLAKLAAFHERPQGDVNNDAAHCAILIDVIPVFLADVAERRKEKLTDYDPGPDAWRLLRVLERGKHPLPVEMETAAQFQKQLREFTMACLMQTGRLAKEAEAKAAIQSLLARSEVHQLVLQELRPCSGPGGWFWTALLTNHGAPSHIAIVDASCQILTAAVSAPLLAADRREGGVLHTFTVLEPVAAGYDAALAASARIRYLDWLCEQCGYIQLDGLPADSDVQAMRLRLERLFVPLNLSESPKRRMLGSLPTAVFIDLPLGASPLGQLMSRHSRIAILAAPGAGKSTLLKRLAVAYADPTRFAAVEDELPRRSFLPVMLRCRELRDRCRQPIRDIISSILSDSLSGGELSAFNGLVDEKLRAGDLLLLVDGLDEISLEGDRRVFVDHLHDFLKLHPQVHAVITSREAGFRAVARTIADVCVRTEIAPLHEHGVRLLCENWHAEVLGDKPKVRQDARELAQTIWANDRIRNLVVNPLLLTTLLVVRRWVGRLPERRVTLYGKAIEVLLMTWNTEGHDPIPEEEALPQLSFIACWMMQQGVQRVGRRQLLDLLKQARVELEAELFGSKVPPHEFIDRIESRSSLLMQVGQEVIEDQLQPVYEFRHLTFQEYLAARGFAEGQYPGHQNSDDLADLLEIGSREHRWREVVILATLMARREADAIVRKLTEAAKVQSHGIYDRRVLLLDLLADEPQIQASTALHACEQIVSRSHGFEFSDLVDPGGDSLDRLAAGRFGPMLMQAASTHFMRLDSGFDTAEGYLAACALAEIPSDDQKAFSDRMAAHFGKLVHERTAISKIKTCLLLKSYGQTISSHLIESMWGQLVSPHQTDILRWIDDESPPVLVAFGWVIAVMSGHNLIHEQEIPSLLSKLILRIDEYADTPVQNALCLTISELPLMPREAFVKPHGVDLAVLAGLLWQTDESETQYWIKQAAFVIGWYARAPWTDSELVKIYRETETNIEDGKWARGDEILTQLGEEGRALLSQLEKERWEYFKDPWDHGEESE